MWAGISWNGATEVCIFEGTMDRFLYVEVLRTTLLPFVQTKYPRGHRLIQDNDPKHVQFRQGVDATCGNQLVPHPARVAGSQPHR